MREQTLAEKAVSLGKTASEVFNQSNGLEDFPGLCMMKRDGEWVFLVNFRFKDGSSINWEIKEFDQPQTAMRIS